MAKSADPDQLASEEANWSGSTLFAEVGYIRVQQTRVKFMLLLFGKTLLMSTHTICFLQINREKIVFSWKKKSILSWATCIRDQATGRLGRNSRLKGLKVALGSPEGDKNFALRFLQLLKKLVLVQNELFVGRNPVKIEQTCKGKNLLKNVVRCIRNATEWKSDVI